MTYRKTDIQTEVEIQTNRETGGHTHKLRDSQTYRQTWECNILADRETGRHTNIQRDRWTYRKT